MSSSTLAERLLIFSQRYPLLPKDMHFFAYKIEKREKVVGRVASLSTFQPDTHRRKSPFLSTL